MKNAQIPTREEAEEIAMRFIDGHFKNPGRERPRIRIPADPNHDDDIRLLAFIRSVPAPEVVTDGERLDWLEGFYAATGFQTRTWESFMQSVAVNGFREAIDAQRTNGGKGT